MFQKGLFKSSHQCRQRWNNHLDPTLRKTQWTLEQDLQLLIMYRDIGQRWAKIAKLNGRRNQHMIKNRYNSLKNKWAKSNNQIFKLNRLIKDIQHKINQRKIQNQNQILSKIQTESINILQKETSREIQIKLQQNMIAQQKLQQQSPFNWLSFDERQVQQNESKIQAIQQVFSIPSLPSQILCMIYKGQKGERQLGTNDSQDYQWLDNMIEQKNNKWLQQDDY